MTQHAFAEQPATMNGLSTQGIVDTVGAIQADPGLARFQFRARNKWIDGGENRSTIRDFYGAGARTIRAAPRSCSPTASLRYCSATTRAPTPWSSCCMRSPAA